MWQDKGFIENARIDVSAAISQLEALIVSVRARYEKLDEDALLKPPAPGKWSRQQVLGHLVDSALNNLKRFTEAQVLERPYTIIGYRQDELVAVNHYQDMPLAQLLDLWQSLNRQIVFVVGFIPADALQYAVTPQYDQTGTQTLAWLICDYVAHLQHHLRNIE